MKRSMILRQLMINRDMKVSDISKQSGVAYSTVKSILENGTGKASYINICKICASLGITPDDLEHMVKENTIHEFQLSKEDSGLLSKYHSLDPIGQSHVDSVLDWETERVNQLKKAQKQISELESRSSILPFPKRLLSYYGRIAAAGKSYGFEDILCGTIEIPFTDSNQSADYTIGVSGDSMYPDFNDGDIVYVQKTDHLNRDDIGIFQKDNCIYIKKVGDGKLVSINPSYDPIPGEDVKVLGKVIGKIEDEYQIIK